ncbi:MAG: ABC transporter ATP-binding protein [Phycisphaerales bacterium]
MSSAQRISPISPTIIGSPAWISDELIGACAGFGVVPSRGTQPRHRPIPLDATMIDRIGRQRVVQIVGPSGAGKSSLLRCLAAHLDTGRVLIVPESLRAAQEQTASFDLLAGDADARASTLALAGLAEPRLWALPAGVLSCGERARLRLAMTMQRARAGDVVICDEFASNLDRVSAFALSRTVRRWAQRAGVTLVVASAHEDLESMLGADLVIDAGTRQTREGSPQQSQAIRIEPGSIEDYHALRTCITDRVDPRRSCARCGRSEPRPPAMCSRACCWCRCPRSTACGVSGRGPGGSARATRRSMHAASTTSCG